MTERLRTILWTIPVTLALIALSFGAWWLWVERPAQLAAQPDAAGATATPVTRYYQTVCGTAQDQNGKGVKGVIVRIGDQKSVTVSEAGDWLVNVPVTLGAEYAIEITVPDGWYLVKWPASFVAEPPPDPIYKDIVLAPIPAPQPTATDAPAPSATPTDTPSPWPTATATPTIDPAATPTATPRCAGYHQFSYSERWTAIATGAALIGRDLGEILDWQNDETLVYAAEINLGAPLTRDYEITADDGSRIWCRAYAQGILAIRQVWPCKAERYGVVQWDGVENWVGGELP